MCCPKCKSESNFFVTLYFKYCWKCEQEKIAKTKRKQERRRLKFNTHKE